jgi:hypothetical protein
MRGLWGGGCNGAERLGAIARSPHWRVVTILPTSHPSAEILPPLPSYFPCRHVNISNFTEMCRLSYRRREFPAKVYLVVCSDNVERTE